MRSVSVLLLILVSILAINAAPGNRRKTIRVPFRLVDKRTTSRLDRRSTANIPLRSYLEKAWIGTIAIGTPPVNFDVMFDTGSTYSWVADSTCVNCGDLPRYDGGASKTFYDIDEEFYVGYQDGTAVFGTWTGDKWHFGQMPDFWVPFGRAKQIPQDVIDAKSSGLVGLRIGRRPSNPYPLPSLIEVMSATAVLDDGVIGCRFVKDNAQQAGELLLGGVETQFVDGDIQYTNVITAYDGPDWAIPIDDVQVAGKSIGKAGEALVDTGTMAVLMSEPSVEAVYAGTSAKRMDDGLWVVPDPFPSDVTFVIGKGQFTVPAADMVLRDLPKFGDMYPGAVQAGENGPYWVLGTPFIKNQYLAFDFGKQAIGIGKRNDYHAANGMSSGDTD